MSTLEVRDVDKLTTKEEVTAAIKSALSETIEIKIFVSKANSWGQKMAIITLANQDEKKFLT